MPALPKRLAAALMLLPVVAVAQFKCVDAGGKTSFQQTPCAAQQKQEALRINAAPPAPTAARPAAAPTLTVDQRMLANIERDKRIEAIETAIAQAEAGVNDRNNRMANEMEMIRIQKTRARNNLAGATWEQSLSMEMQAVASKYKAINDAEFERMKVLRTQLDAARQVASR